MSRLRLTVRTRLTLLYAGLFAVCGAIVVAVSYTLVAGLGASGQEQGKGRQPSPRDLADFAARCRSAETSVRPDPHILAKCASYFQLQGAQGQRDLTLSYLLQYSLITLAMVIALAAILGWIFSGRALRPVHQITAAARAASEHNLSARVAPTGPRDELRELVHATLEPAVISGDPVLAERLITNLVDNAIRYNIAAGDIWISTRTTAGSSQLTVANTGPDISPADADHIFQPFQRLSYRTSHDGSGLGLAIVASIAAIHDGTVTARPRNGGGLSVTVTIPSAGDPAPDIGIQAAEGPGVPRPR